MQEISAEIITRAAQGDKISFEEIYKVTSAFVYNVALRVVNNRDDAEEVAQEVFMTVYRKLKEFRFEASFRTWIYRITVNHAINFARKNSKMRKRTVEYEEGLLKGSVNNDIEADLEREERRKKLQRLLSAINLDQRAVVTLRDIQGLSYHEIGQVLKININTVRSRLRRAREKMLALTKGV